jgi:hypothetical protein
LKTVILQNQHRMKKIFFAGIPLLILMTTLSQTALPHPSAVGDPTPKGQAGTDTLRNGQHDFDFNLGNWKTHIRRRLTPYTGTPKWIELNGTVTVRKVWDGRASLEEIEADGQTGHFEGTTLFLYNPTSHQWSQNFANSIDGDISNPTIGQFKDGRGELYSQDIIEGKAVMLQGVWSRILKDSHRYEESVSYDAGKTWEPVFIADLTRDTSTASVVASTPAALADAGTDPALANAGADSASAASGASADHDGRHDFDFAFGRWKEHTTRLQHPLTGSTTWISMEGVSVCKKIWNGKANLTELESNGPNGHLELLALRLYNTQSRQWNLTFATSGVGVLGMPPCIGEFRNGHGEFYDQELYNGKAIWVRFTVTPLTPDSFRSEQAFSDDGGKTWETNWINEYTRL